MQVHEKLQALLSSPRSKKKKNKHYVEARRKTSALETSKQEMVKALTALKEDGGTLTGGKHKDTYDHNLKKQVKKKMLKKEEAAKQKELKKTKKKLATNKMIATKLKKNKEKKEAEAAAAAEKEQATETGIVQEGAAASSG